MFQVTGLLMGDIGEACAWDTEDYIDLPDDLRTTARTTLAAFCAVNYTRLGLELRDVIDFDRIEAVVRSQTCKTQQQ